jgi:hypothetical protein
MAENSGRLRWIKDAGTAAGDIGPGLRLQLNK